MCMFIRMLYSDPCIGPPEGYHVHICVWWKSTSQMRLYLAPDVYLVYFPLVRLRAGEEEEEELPVDAVELWPPQRHHIHS